MDRKPNKFSLTFLLSRQEKSNNKYANEKNELEKKRGIPEYNSIIHQNNKKFVYDGFDKSITRMIKNEG